MNRVYLVGRVGKDPEMKYFETGKQVCNFTLAVSQKLCPQRQSNWRGWSVEI